MLCGESSSSDSNLLAMVIMKRLSSSSSIYTEIFVFVFEREIIAVGVMMNSN